jgi:hypothetical protein
MRMRFFYNKTKEWVAAAQNYYRIISLMPLCEVRATDPGGDFLGKAWENESKRITTGQRGHD